MWNHLKKLLQYREMLIVLVQKELKTRYKGSILGFFWNILNPLLMMLVYAVVFHFVARGGQLQNYPIYLLCGLIPWTWHANAIASGTTSIVANGSLINKIYFPTEILPLVMVCANFIHFLFGMGLLLIFLPFFGYGIHLGFLWMIILFLIQAIFITGIVFILAPLHVFYRDVQNILNVVLPMWFFMTPIIYPMSLIPDSFKFWFSLNPMLYVIEGYQTILYRGSAGISLAHTGLILIVSLIILILGYTAFDHWRSRLPEEV